MPCVHDSKKFTSLKPKTTRKQLMNLNQESYDLINIKRTTNVHVEAFDPNIPTIHIYNTRNIDLFFLNTVTTWLMRNNCDVTFFMHYIWCLTRGIAPKSQNFKSKRGKANNHNQKFFYQRISPNTSFNHF